MNKSPSGRATPPLRRSTAAIMRAGGAKDLDLDHGKVKDEPPRYFGEMWRRTKAAPRQDPEPPADWEAQHPPPPTSGPQPDSPEVPKLITAFNHKYFVLNENGRAVVYAPSRRWSAYGYHRRQCSGYDGRRAVRHYGWPDCN